jgi:hypothetical protein
MDPFEGPYEGDAIYEAIAVTLFRTPTSVGVLFPGYYKPCPLTGAAFSVANVSNECASRVYLYLTVDP